MLVAEQIFKQYKKPVLNGVSLTVSAGEIIGIAGENGSGKSTLLSVLTGILRPDSGRVTVEGEDIFQNPRALRRWIGYVPQDNSLFDNLTAMDNIKFWASAYGAPWQKAFAFLFPNESAETQKQFLKTKASKLSGGMKKRLSIALSMLHDPAYLLMDEPTAALDIGFKWLFNETLSLLKERGQTVIFTSHQPDELLHCDRLYVLRDGVFAFEGEPQALGGDADFTQTLYGLIKGRGTEENRTVRV